MKKSYYVILFFCLAAIAACIAVQTRRTGEIETDEQRLEEQLSALKIYETGTAVHEPETDPVPPDTDTQIEVLQPQTDLSTAAVTIAPDAQTESVVAPGRTPETAAPATVQTTAPPSPSLQETRLDFDAMREINPDICAWIEIDGTKVDYPILQDPEDDDTYLQTAYDETYYIGGSLFTQATYNAADFSDPVTMIYGHTMRSGTLFGQLQTVYTDAETFRQHRDIKLYLPDEVRHYTVFAAVPYDSIHILHTYDFTNEYWYKTFFKNVFDIREIGAQFDEDSAPSFGDRVIILSTCLSQDSTRRFLVMAVLSEDLLQ